MPKMSPRFMKRGAVIALAGLMCLPGAASAQMAPEIQVQRTPHYTVGLTVGAVSATDQPADMHMMADEADQGMAVNHGLDVRITAGDTEMVVSDVTPTIRITDKTTGASRDLPNVMAMHDMAMGASDLHYGQNVFLPDGTYLVSVLVAPGDTAEFRDVMVMAEPMMGDHSMGH
jgi:hypothetical protein